MRADRLLSLLMLLQVRGRMTAEELAEELEVSVRTIYRDIEALSVAGVPVYSDRGPGGGCALLENYRMDLTGLTREQVRALFMLSIPAPLDELGLGDELRAALLKLSAALPDSQRSIEAQARHRIHVDSTPWLRRKESHSFLNVIQQAIWQKKKLLIQFIYPVQHWTHIERLVEPYGLVVKGSAWHLVYVSKNRMRVFPVDRLVQVTSLEERFERRADFDLAGFWDEWCDRQAGHRLTFHATVQCSPEAAPGLERLLEDHITNLSRQSMKDGGWIEYKLAFASLEEARDRLLGFGGAVEVMEPAALRLSLLDYARQIVQRYESGDC